jgi:hypothetical protein
VTGRKRKRRKLNPRKLVKRLVVLGILGLFVWLVTLTGRGVYRLAMGVLNRPDWIDLVAAVEVKQDTGVAAEAFLLQKELVVLADKPGRANLLVEEGDQVEVGQLVMEVVDKTLLASIESEIARLDAEAAKPSGDQSGDLASLDEKIASSNAALVQAMADYQKAILSRQLEGVSELYNKLNSLAKEVSSLQQDRLRLAQTQTARQERRAQLEERRKQAISGIYAPAAGRISFLVDGLEQLADPGQITADLWGKLKAQSQQEYQVVPDAKIVAGQPAFKVIEGGPRYLLTKLADANPLPLGTERSLDVQLGQGEDAQSFTVSLAENAALGEGQLLLEIPDDCPPLGRNLRFTLYAEAPAVCRIPRTALVTLDEQVGVMTLEDTITRFHPVSVQTEERRTVLVTGIEPGLQVVSNATGLTDGEDVANRLRK